MMPRWLLSILKAIFQSSKVPNAKSVSFSARPELFSNNKKYVFQNNTIILNLNVTGKQTKKRICGACKETYAQRQSLITETKRTEIKTIIAHEQDPDATHLLMWARELVPLADIPILRACCVLRVHHKLGEPVAKFKEDITKRYGERGRNLANLCSADYFETWFFKINESLLEKFGAKEGRRRFLLLYEEIVTKQPWTIFVSHAMTEEELGELILNRLCSYRTGFVYVHGLGNANTSKIEKIAKELPQKEPEIVAVKVETQMGLCVRFSLSGEEPSLLAP